MDQLNHTIWLTDNNNNVMYLPAGLISYWKRDGQSTAIYMNNGNCVMCKTPPEEVERKYNQYVNSMIKR